VSDSCRSVCGSGVQIEGTAMAIGRSANLSDEVTEGRSSVRAEEERVEREGWIGTADGDRRAERIEVYMYYK